MKLCRRQRLVLSGSVNIQKIELVKFYENSSWKPETHYLTPTQQEYRVIRRILEYITEEEDY